MPYPSSFSYPSHHKEGCLKLLSFVVKWPGELRSLEGFSVEALSLYSKPTFQKVIAESLGFSNGRNYLLNVVIRFLEAYSSPFRKHAWFCSVLNTFASSNSCLGRSLVAVLFLFLPTACAWIQPLFGLLLSSSFTIKCYFCWIFNLTIRER